MKSNKDGELIQLLKGFIAEQQRIRDGEDNTYNITENGIADQNDHVLVPLQEHLINQITNPHVTRIRGAPCKRRMKNGMEMFKKIRNPMNLIEGSTNETNQTQESNQTGRQQ